MTDVAAHVDDLRIAVGETEALAAITAELYDRQDWSGADPFHVERLACLLGLLSKSATAAMAAFHRLHGAVADAQPTPAGERCDYRRHGQRRVDEPSTAAAAGAPSGKYKRTLGPALHAGWQDRRPGRLASAALKRGEELVAFARRPRSRAVAR
jgi:hypothetical protein